MLCLKRQTESNIGGGDARVGFPSEALDAKAYEKLAVARGMTVKAGRFQCFYSNSRCQRSGGRLYKVYRTPAPQRNVPRIRTNKLPARKFMHNKAPGAEAARVTKARPPARIPIASPSIVSHNFP